MKGHVDLLGPANEVKEELTGIPSFESPDYSTPLSEEKAMIKKMKKTFLMVAGAAMQKYGEDIENHQELLMASADVLMEIYMAESAILRAQKNIEKTSEEEAKYQVAMAQLYLYYAVEKVNEKAKKGIISFAEGDEQKMMLMGLKRYTKYENYPNIIALQELVAKKVVDENTYPF